MTTKTKKRTKTRVQDLEQIIKIQEKIIKANKTENDILSKCIKKAYDREDNNQQWAYWYRAWSEYLERTIQNAFKKQDWSVFKIYYKILKKLNSEIKGAVKEIKEVKNMTELQNRKLYISE